MIAARQIAFGTAAGAKVAPQMTFVIDGASFKSDASSLGLSTDDGSPIVVDWGDGTKTTSPSGTSLGDHTYPRSGTWTAKVYSDGVITRIEQNCFYKNLTLTSVSIPPTVTYLGGYCIRETGITEFVFQRQYTYGMWAVYGCNALTRMRFEGKFVPLHLCNYDYPNLVTVEFGKDVNDEDINDINSGILIVSCVGKCKDVVVDPENPYYEVRGHDIGVPQIVRKSDNCLILPAFGLIGERKWDGRGVDSSVRNFTNELTRSLQCTKFTVPYGVENCGSGFCRDNTNITEVDIAETVSVLGHWPFYSSPNISKIVCRAYVPPTIVGSFGNYNTGAVLHVPVGCADAYRVANLWGTFTTIVDDIA